MKLGNLGEVVVRVELAAKGGAHVVLESAHAQAATWLRENAAAVSEGLAQRGLGSAQVEVRSTERSGDGRGFEQSKDRGQEQNGQEHGDASEREAWSKALGRRYRNTRSAQQGEFRLVM